ncbi:MULTISPECIES: hypothetical protein [unclassified Sphingobium]|uniref:hypothetical protein n=1 Tax=unclassified Sphingobium TaxID=2611147 RepID=UPI0035A66225
MIEVSWHNARWSSFSERLESLTDVLRQASGKAEDPDVNWHKMKAWAAAYGQAVEEN